MLLSGVVDSHCHVHDALGQHAEDAGGDGGTEGHGPAAPLHGELAACVAGLARVATMGTRPGDWAAVAALAAAWPERVVPAYGVHPWHAHRLPAPPNELPSAAAVGTEPPWCAQLRARLQATPAAVVGEIGLDKVARLPDRAPGPADLAHQQALFRWQLALAGALRRPVSVHCVRASAAVVETLRALPQAARPPAVAMHSYLGSADTVRLLLRVGVPVFFGFSACICLRAPDRARAAAAVVPPDRVLVESDHADPAQVHADLHVMLAWLADVQGWAGGAPEAAARTAANARRWLALPP
jgi:Tat protein secretion system quality control protein TatD with DNase activity